MDGQPPASPTDESGPPDKVGTESVEEKPAVRRLWWVWSLLALVVLTVGAFAATRSALLDVDEVLVDGVGGRLDRLLVVEVSGIRTGEPMVDVSSEAAARRVATLPWVAEAKVVRDWPGTVRIWFVERQAVVNAVPVYKGDRSSVAVGVSQDVQLILPKGAGAGLEASVTVNEPLIAPLDQQQQVGNLILGLEGKEIGAYPLVTLDAINQGSWTSRMLDVIRLRFR